MKYYFNIITLFFALFTVLEVAQATAKPDPKAKEILRKMKAKRDAQKSVRTDFSFIIEAPGEAKQSTKGKLHEQGKHYRLQMAQQDVISDGKSVWFFLKEQNEVQITDASEESSANGVLSPRQLYTMYENKNYDYVLSAEMQENGRLVQQIEFKPLDRRSDFFKLRLTLDKQTLQPLNIKAFSRDGTRYTLVIDKITPNAAMDKTLFVFQQKNYPNAHIEDLRLD